MTSACYTPASARVSLARTRTKRRARNETATPRETLREATIVPERCARVSTSIPTDPFPSGAHARSEDPRNLHADAFERGSDDAEGDRSVLRVEGDQRRCRRAVPETPLRNALTPLVHERVPTSRHGTDTPSEVTSPRTRTIHTAAAFYGEHAAGKPEKTVVGVAAACQRFLRAGDVGRADSTRLRLARSSADSAETGDDAQRRGAANRPTRESRGRKTPTTDVEDVNVTRVSFGDSDDESDEAPPSPIRRSDFAAAGVHRITSVAAALDDIDDRAGIQHEELEELEEHRGSPPPPDASSPARKQKRRHEAAASNLDTCEPSRTPFDKDVFRSAKREPDARLPLTLMRHGSDQSIASKTGPVSDIELLTHRASLQEQLGDFVHLPCVKRSRFAEDARHEASRHGDGRVVFNLSAAEFQPRTLDVSAGTKSQICVQIVTPDLQRDEALEMVHHPMCSPVCTGRSYLSDLFGLGESPGDPGLGALRVTDQFEADLKHALELELAC